MKNERLIQEPLKKGQAGAHKECFSLGRVDETEILSEKEINARIYAHTRIHVSRFFPGSKSEADGFLAKLRETLGSRVDSSPYNTGLDSFADNPEFNGYPKNHPFHPSNLIEIEIVDGKPEDIDCPDLSVRNNNDDSYMDEYDLIHERNAVSFSHADDEHKNESPEEANDTENQVIQPTEEDMKNNPGYELANKRWGIDFIERNFDSADAQTFLDAFHMPILSPWRDTHIYAEIYYSLLEIVSLPELESFEM